MDIGWWPRPWREVRKKRHLRLFAPEEDERHQKKKHPKKGHKILFYGTLDNWSTADAASIFYFSRMEATSSSSSSSSSSASSSSSSLKKTKRGGCNLFVLVEAARKDRHKSPNFHRLYNSCQCQHRASINVAA